MITPQEVRARNENTEPYEKQIDESLSAPWTDEMQQQGRMVSYRLYAAARNAGVSDVPNTVQLARLKERYQKAGWVFRDDPKSANAWIFEYPKGKTP